MDDERIVEERGARGGGHAQAAWRIAGRAQKVDGTFRRGGVGFRALEVGVGELEPMARVGEAVAVALREARQVEGRARDDHRELLARRDRRIARVDDLYARTLTAVRAARAVGAHIRRERVEHERLPERPPRLPGKARGPALLERAPGEAAPDRAFFARLERDAAGVILRGQLREILGSARHVPPPALEHASATRLAGARERRIGNAAEQHVRAVGPSGRGIEERLAANPRGPWIASAA